ALALPHPGLELHHARGRARHDQARQRTRIRQGLASAAVRDEPRALPGASDALAQQVREIPTLLPCGGNRITGHQDAKRQHAPERSRLLWWQPRRQTCEDPARMSAFRPKRLSIATISAEPMSIELSEPFGIATGSQLCAANVLVRLGRSDGSCGLGDAAPFPAVSGETQQGTLTALERVKHEFLGEPAERWRLVCQKMQELLPDQPSAACALECALLDAWLRSLGCSMWCFFGGSERSLVSDLTLPTGSVDAAARAARRALSLGFRLRKAKGGGQALDLDAERLRAIARSVPDARLVLDANGALSAEQALDL